jgi:photosystem II stability/assembly factor-like uncharacterized protein
VWLGGSERPLWFSSDGGDRFAPVETAPLDFIHGVHFWDPMHGLLTSDTGDRVHVTSDGGASWQTHSFGRDVLPGIDAFAVLGPEVWVVGGASFTGSGATIGHSSDGGNQWTVSQLHDRANDFKGGALKSIAVVSASELWVAGEGRQIYHTVDGMKSWTQVAAIPPAIDRFGGIAVDGMHIVAGANTANAIGIYESFDDGVHWEFRDFSKACSSNCEIYGVIFAKPGIGYAYGRAGTFLRYSN